MEGLDDEKKKEKKVETMFLGSSFPKQETGERLDKESSKQRNTGRSSGSRGPTAGPPNFNDK